jgi:hypothetical protein
VFRLFKDELFCKLHSETNTTISDSRTSTICSGKAAESSITWRDMGPNLAPNNKGKASEME